MLLRGAIAVARRSLKNVVAQFIGQLCLMNQATTKSGGEARFLVLLGTSSAIPQILPGKYGGLAC
jgi:hypothetical protein